MKNIRVAAVIAALSVSGVAYAAEAEKDGAEVAYQALSEGRTAEAIAQLDKSPAVAAGDPAALINLGTAYSRQGRDTEARAQFTAALNSRDHYYLELADGRWVDSRNAAKMALDHLARKSDIALR